MVFRHTEHPHGYEPLLQENGSPSGFLLEILDILRIQNNGSAEDIHKIAQTLFLRKKTEERWHISDVYKDKKEALFPVLEKLGVLKEIWPSPELCSSLDYIFIHGGHIEGMRVRLNFLNILWPQISKALQDKVHVVFLSGDRKLDPVEETVDVLLDPQSSSIPFRKEWSIPYPLPTTESGAALLVWDQIILDPDLRKKITFVFAPETKKDVRPTTRDTIYAWLNSFNTSKKISLSSPENPFLSQKKLHIMAISNNPFIPYQDKVFKNVLSCEGLLEKVSSLETVGPEASPKTTVGTHLDNLARWLYESMENFYPN